MTIESFDFRYDNKDILSGIFKDNWRVLLVSISLLIHITTAVRVVLSRETTPLSQDSAVFQYGGWLLMNGGVPYVDLWDIKPPLTYEFTAVLAFISRGDVTTLHWLSVLVTLTASIASVLLIGELVYSLTDSERGSFAAGLTILAFPMFHYLPIFGFRPKVLMLPLGLSALLLQLRDRPFISGCLAAAATGIYTKGLLFAILVVAIASTRHRRTLRQTVAGGATASVVILIPMFILGASTAMVVEVIIAPLTTPDGGSLIFRLGRAAVGFGYYWLLVPLAVLGYATAPRSRWRANWWLPLFGLLVILIALFDMEGVADMFLPVVLIAIGVGFLLADSTGSTWKIASGVILSILLISVLFLGGVGIITYPVNSPHGPLGYSDIPEDRPHLQEISWKIGYQMGAIDTPPDEQREVADNAVSTVSVTDLYWSTTRIDRCHIRLAELEQTWIKKHALDPEAETCGEWPT